MTGLSASQVKPMLGVRSTRTVLRLPLGWFRVGRQMRTTEENVHEFITLRAVQRLRVPRRSRPLVSESETETAARLGL